MIDEAFISPKVAFEIVYSVFKELNIFNKDFGGIGIVIAGDYMQLLTFIPKKEQWEKEMFPPEKFQ